MKVLDLKWLVVVVVLMDGMIAISGVQGTSHVHGLSLKHC